MNSNSYEEIKRFRPDIEGLRGVAALAVISYHLQVHPFEGGFIGVDIFFIISGFLITRLVYEAQQQRSFTYLGFVKSRFSRLYPALIFCLTITFIGGFLLLSPIHFIPFAESLVYAILGTSNFYFLSQAGYFDLSSYLKPLLHTWTLSVEWQFYLLWPFLVCMVPKSNPKKAFLILAGLTVILFLIQEAIYRLPNSSLCQKSSTVLCRDGGESIYFLMPSRAFEFLIGAATTFFPFAKFSKLGATFLNFISVGAILALAILIDPADKFPSFLGLAVCIFAGIIILTPRGYTSFILENCVIRFAGRISYSLYLFHWPVIVLWRYIDTKITLIDNVIMVLIFTFFCDYFLLSI